MTPAPHAKPGMIRKQEHIPAHELLEVLEATADGHLPQLDVLWHYDCVLVSPLPRAFYPPETSAPHSPAHAPSLLLAAHTPLSAASATVDDDTQKSHFQRHVLQRVFSTFDQNRDGHVSTQEITQIFDRLGMPQSEASIQSLLARLVTEWEGHVNEHEFCLLYDSVCSTLEGANSITSCSSSGTADVDPDLLAAFHVFDKDGNGFISPNELQSVLCALGFPQARQLDACVDMIATVDENGDGQVDFFEFKKLFDFEAASLLVSSC